MYCHTNKINDKKYIGITSKEVNQRWKNGNGYGKSQPYFSNAIKKNGWDNFKHEVLFENLTKEEACEKEIELIVLYDTTNQEKGYNSSLGGDLVFQGRHHSKETKELISNRMKELGVNKGEKNWCYGKIPPNKGVPHTKETREKMSRIGKEHFEKYGISKGLKEYLDSIKIRVNQYDLFGNFIKTWDYISEASNELNIAKQNIVNCCKRKQRKDGVMIKSAGGFQWRYEDDCDDIGEYNVRKANHSSQEKEIYQIGEYDNVIKKYKSIEMASKELNLNPSSISAVCNGRYKTTKGYRFKYVN